MRLTNPLRRTLPLMLAVGCAPVGLVWAGAALVCMQAVFFCTPAGAQQLIGYVNTSDAEVTGSTDTLNGQTVLTGSVGVAAKDRPAPILLGRGGTARVCQSSVLRITESKVANPSDAKAANAPLLFSLESGAIEIQMNGTASDAIMTPDLRLSVLNQGALDLRVRVARNGDTCVENRGAGAPTLAVSDPFGESMYEVPGGQHVLFQRGNLHDVVDNESEPCGCPAVAPGMSLGDALLASGGANQGPTLATAPPPAPVVVQVAPQVVVAPASAPAVAPTKPAANAMGTAQVSAAATTQVSAATTTPPVVTQAIVSAPARAAAPVSAPTTAPTATLAPAAPVSAPVAHAAAPIASSAAVTAPAVASAPDASAEQAALQAAEETAAQAAIRAAELRHPFPEVSEAQPDAVPQAAPPQIGAQQTAAGGSQVGQAHVQISDSMSYNAPVAPGAVAPAAKPAPQPVPAPVAAKPAPPPAPVHRNVFQSIGHFFKWMFVG